MTCSQVGPMSLGWPLAPSGGLVQVIRCRKKMQTVNVLKMLTLLLHVSVGDVMLFNHEKCSETDWTKIHESMFRMAAFGALLGIREGSSALLLLRNSPGNEDMLISRALPEILTSIAFRKHTGRMNSCRLFKPSSPCMWVGYACSQKPPARWFDYYASPASSRHSRKGSTYISHDLPRITTSFVFRKPMGWMNSCRLFRYWSRNSGCLVRSHQTV